MFEHLTVILLAVIVAYIRSLHKKIDRMSINPNFGCLTRPALELMMQHRKKGGLGIICWDVSGMGLANKRNGEYWVNQKIHHALDCLQSNLRAGDLVGQLNSGDEFILIAPIKDIPGLQAKIVEIFNLNTLRIDGKPAIYIASGEYDCCKSFVANAHKVMEAVYQLKGQV